MSKPMRAMFVAGLLCSQVAIAQVVVRYPAPETDTLLDAPLPRHATRTLLKRVLRERLPAA